MNVLSFHLMPWTEVEDEVAWPYSDDEFVPEIGSTRYRQYLRQLEYCDELGFDAVGLNEHHYSGYGLMPSPNVMAGHLVAQTSDVDVCLMGNVLPIRGHPVRVAEEVAMLDNLSEGRIVSGFVRGVPNEYAAYNVDPDESRSRFTEAWELIERAWVSDDPFDWDGEHWAYDDVYIWPRPYQDPHPPRWMPAESQKSIEFAAERGIPIGRTYVGTDGMVETATQYRTVAEEQFGRTLSEGWFWPARFVYVAEDTATAREEAEEHLEYFHTKLLSAGFRSGAIRKIGESNYREADALDYQEHVPPKGKKAMNFDFDEFRESGELLVGSPEYVVEEIERQADRIPGFSTLVGFFQFGSLPHENAMKSLELFADEVLPEIRGLGAEDPILGR